MKDVEHICIYCGHSMLTEEDELFCVIKQEIVKDEETCEEYN